MKSRSYSRTSASIACAALTQWIVPFTFRPDVAPPVLLSRSAVQRSSTIFPSPSFITSSQRMM